ncbi:restriction endonuclease subunit S [Segatella copri]|uniref:restriction endonuclease subunit S n=1 Tax=Segatella copri TaxID=165179 RepID=UPI001C45DFC9|nr:restriction endonuclease subunit S [Segatella copri]MBW0032610.1 restriction endonuclease subunit S [Segatella copri]
MKNLETLIQELCPDGVEFLKLGDVGTFYGGLSGKSKADFTDGNAKLVTYMNVYSNPALNTDIKDFVKIEEGEKQNKILYGDILFTGSSETPNECGMTSVLTEKTEEDFYLNSFCFGYRFNDIDDVNPGFMKHLFRSHMLRKALAKTASGVTRFNVSKKKVANIEIPLPPIEVQTEIVRILDKFTSLEAELEAELDCRKRQYEYYRDKLLSFDNVGGQEVEWKKMSEVFDMKNGYTPSKAKAEYWEGGTIPWFRMEDIRENGRILSDSIQHITMVGVKKGKLFPANSFILATTATIGEHALVISDSLANQQFTNLTVRKSLSDRLLIKFVFHYMFIVDEWCKKNINVSGFASVDMNKFKKLEFPIPSLEEQHRIVSILDRFESLTTSLQSGLPAEITARRQQYEYYRDKLLTFKRKGAA